jgi:hypothetical protein
VNNFEKIASLAMDDIRRASRSRIYQTDFQAWKADVLGHRTYSKMVEIGDTALFGPINHTVIKSANGTAKSFEMADMITWLVSVFPIGESVAIISAPSVPQIQKVVFAYLKSNYSLATARKNKLPGWINESLEWKYDTPAGTAFLAFGRKPPEQDAVSVFQGVRSSVGRTFVFYDEAGGMSRPMYTAAEAVMTGQDSRFIGIGNPDNSGTQFHDVFRDNDRYEKEYNRFTISAFDLPTITGERVYPRTPEGDEMEEKMLSALTSKKWVEHKQRVWGEKDARYLSKVLGEFPADGGNSFFALDDIDKAFLKDTPAEEDRAIAPLLGADIARWGQDESVVYENRNGRVRLVEAWGKTDTVETARKIHQHAMRLGAAEVRLDAGGVGGGVFDQLDLLMEFNEKTYTLIAVDNGAKSPDSAQWANNRAYNHDSLRSQLREGTIDLDYDDKELRDQLQIVTYKFNTRGAIQITAKDDMKTEMGGSPDRLDALILSTVDLSWLTDGGVRPGDVVDYDQDALVVGSAFYSMGETFGW